MSEIVRSTRSSVRVLASLVALAFVATACQDGQQAPTALDGSSPSFAKPSNPGNGGGGGDDDGGSTGANWTLVADAFDVASDGKGTLDADGDGNDDANGYVDEDQCVRVAIDKKFYQLRTIRNTDACKALARGEWRYLQLSGTGLDLDQDGTVESTEDAPARFIAPDLFAPGRTSSTPVTILVLTVNDDGSTTQDTRYRIEYVDEAPIDKQSDRHAIELPSGSASDLATVCEPQADGSCSHVTDVNLSFHVEAGPKP